MTTPTSTSRPPTLVAEPLLVVDGLTVAYPTKRGILYALRDVSLSVAAGEAVGLAGESGSGKSTLLRALLGLLPPGAHVSARGLRFRSRELLGRSEREWRSVRGGAISMVFQDPVNVFTPSLTIGRQLSRALRLHRRSSSTEDRQKEILAMLERVGIDGRGSLDRYPFQFSQGQLQRIMIAAACLSGYPALVLADEPTTSLDVTTEAQILQLLRDLRDELGLAVILVTHDIAVIAELCDRILVMYAGRLVEEAPVTTFLRRPAHPYSDQLLRSIPPFPGGATKLYAMGGEPPDPLVVMPGCPFGPRCERHLGMQCDLEAPKLTRTSWPGQSAACHLYREHHRPTDGEFSDGL